MSDARPHYHPPPVAIHPEGHAPTPHHPWLQHHFDNMEQQAEASTLGMWVFLVTEIMFFGGLFMAYLVYRHQSPTGFQEASHHLNIYWGAANTAILIISSLTMALAVRAAQTSQPPKVQVRWLLATIVLGMAFLGIKAIEYTDKFRDHIVPGPHFQWEGLYPKPAEQFYSLYFAMTGLHALHMIIGVGLLLYILRRAMQNEYSPAYWTPVDIAGLYWHFVDIVWIFLFPLLYLIDRHMKG